MKLAFSVVSPPPLVVHYSLDLYFMSQFSYSFTLQILELSPRVVNPGLNISNSVLTEPLSVMLPPLRLIVPYEKSPFDWLLERQENEGVGNHREFDYVGFTAHSPLHCVPSQQTPAWIVTHMGIEGEGKVSELAKLEPGMGVQLFDEGLSKRNYGFEKVWLFGIIGRPYGWEPGYHIFWLEPTFLPSCNSLFQSGFLLHSSQFQTTSFLNGIILVKSTSVRWARG